MNPVPKPNKIIWVVIDTLRADHLSLYGYPRRTSPFLERLAKEAVVFDWAFSTCSYSSPAHTSMVTGKYCPNHCTGFSNGPPVKPVSQDVFLAEILSAAGYATASFFSDLTPVQREDSAVATGFRERFSPKTETCWRGINKDLTTWLNSRVDDKAFALINYFDVHGPYRHDAPYDGLFCNDELSAPPLHFRRIRPNTDPAGGLPEYQILKGVVEDGFLLEYETDLRYYLAQYDAGIVKVDQALRELKDFLTGLGIYDDTLLIVSADHGEAFGENNLYCGHGFTLTPDQIHVPLIIKPHRGWNDLSLGRIRTQVSLVDVMPTILESVGHDYNSMDIDGRSLANLMKGRDQRLENRTIMAETSHQTCRIDAEKLHITPKPQEEVEAQNTLYSGHPGFRYAPRPGAVNMEEMEVDYREEAPSPLLEPPEGVFFRPLPWIRESNLDLKLSGLRKHAFYEFLWATQDLEPRVDNLRGELNRVRGELAAIPAPIRSLVEMLRSWEWLRKAVGAARKRRVRSLDRKSGS